MKRNESVTHYARCRVLPIVFVCLAVVSCITRKEETPMPDLRPGVLILTVDSLRADFLGCYGNPVIRSPSIDREARRSWQCIRAYTHAPYTVPALASIMTSLFPFQHNAGNIVLKNESVDNSSESTVELSDIPLAPSIDTWASALRKRGYQTRAYVSGFTTSATFSGLNNGFMHYNDDKTGPARPARAIVDELLRDSPKLKDTPCFLWTHLFDTHFPYHAGMQLYADGDFRLDVNYAQLRSSERLTTLVGADPVAADWSMAVVRYATAITMVDKQVGRLLDGLRTTMGNRKMLLVLTSDHGENLLDSRELFDHGRFLFEPTVRIPLFINTGKQMMEKDRIFDSMFRGVDVRPTIDDFLGSSTPRSGTVGQSMKSVLLGVNTIDKEQTVIDSKAWIENSAQTRSRALIDGIWKYIEISSSTGKQVHLFNLDTDPGERSDLHSQLKEKSRQTAELLASFEQLVVGPDLGMAAASSHDQGTKDQLKSLGYLGD